jgi:ectoine hydroxylase-related dioxygenase (phytanoyl-CoA dioxygenase family)
MSAMGQPSVRLTDAQVKSFRREGFVRIEALADAAELEVLLGLYDELFRREGGFDAGDRIDLVADTGREQLPQIVNPERYAPQLIGGSAYRNAGGIARQLLGPGCVPTGNHAILKPAQVGPDTPWHQDEAYWDPRFAHRAVSIWLALQPATRENGCMRFIPGSHRGPVLPHELISADAHGLRATVMPPGAREIACELPAGGATLHDGRTLHAAGPNVSGRPRRALVFGFGLAPVALETPNHYPWQRPEWYAHAENRSPRTR